MRLPFGKIWNLIKPVPSQSFQIEVEKDHETEENIALVRDLQDMLSKCPRDARVTFGVNEGGNMRLLLDTFLHYNKDLNEVVLYPFNRPSTEVEMDNIPENEDT